MEICLRFASLHVCKSRYINCIAIGCIVCISRSDWDKLASMQCYLWEIRVSGH